MATTAIWAVKGWLGKVVIYVENPDKTENPSFYQQPDMTDSDAQGLSDVIEYAVQKDKVVDVSVQQFYVSGVNCAPSTARDEMMAVKKRYGKADGIVAFHGYQSFAPGEVTSDTAHEIGIRMARELWGDRFQIVVATHLDKANHIHNHFVINSVSFMNGKRYNDCTATYMEMRKRSDALCLEYGLSVIQDPQRGKAKQYGEWLADKDGRSTYRGEVKRDIDAALAESMTERQLWQNLRNRGYTVKFGKDITMRPPGKDRGLKLCRNFGEDYSIEGLRRRILAQSRPERSLPTRERGITRARLVGSFKTVKKATGFRALYLHYCYVLGIFPKNKPNRAPVHFLYREDLRRLNQISDEARLLCAYRIDTAAQLSLYKAELAAQMESVTEQRGQLYKRAHSAGTGGKAEIKEQIAALTARLSELRREVKLCEGIETRSGVIAEKLRTVREGENARGKEKTRDEYIGRSGGTGRPNELGRR